MNDLHFIARMNWRCANRHIVIGIHQQGSSLCHLGLLFSSNTLSVLSGCLQSAPASGSAAPRKAYQPIAAQGLALFQKGAAPSAHAFFRFDAEGGTAKTCFLENNRI
jgi:hypothetical protein